MKDKAQKIFNAWIRKRDSKDGYFVCISCGLLKPEEFMDAGHYVPVKTGSFFRYDEDNVHGECRYCNRFNDFHLIGYRKNLINKIGIEKVEFLEQNSRRIKKWERNELLSIVAKYKM